MMDLALNISADPSQAEAEIEKFAGEVKSLGAAVAAAGKEQAQMAESASAAMQGELDELGLIKDAWMQNAAATREYGATLQSAVSEAVSSTQAQEAAVDALGERYTDFGTTVDAEINGVLADAENVGVRIGEGFGEAQVATEGFGAGLRANLGDLQALRRAFYSIFFFSAAAYIVPQLEQMGQEVATLAQQVGGYDAGLQQLMQDAVKYNEKQIDAYRTLSIVQQQTVNGIGDENQARLVTAQYILVNAKAALAAREAENQGLQQQIEAIRAEDDILREQYAFTGALLGYVNDHFQHLANLQKQLDAGQEDQKKIGLDIAKIDGDLAKAQEAIAKSSEHGAAGTDKFAQAQQRLDEAIATAQVKLPPFISEIERLQKALLLPEGKENNTLFAYAEENAQRLQDGLAPLSATLQQLGIEIPKLTMSGVNPASTQVLKDWIGTWGEWVKVIKDGKQQIEYVLHPIEKLTEAQRLALPTERELALATQELTRDYPTLTNAERAEWAQIMLTSDAYRKHIDEASRVKTSNAQLAGSFNALATQVRTAFSEMAGQITGWGGVATRVFDQVFNSITRQIEIEQRQAAEHQISQFSMTKATIDGLKQLAPVKAIIDTAKGIEALASFDFAAAAQWFAAAALWGTVGAFQIASMAGAFQPGTSGSKAVATAASASSGSAAGSHALASGSTSAQAAAQKQQGTIQVIFQGPVYGGRAATQEIISNINAAVKFNRMQLNASHNPTGVAL